jgi:hypothetical protein
LTASWPAIVEMIDAHFEIRIRGEHWIGLRHGGFVKVKVQLVTELGRDWVVTTADVMAANLLPAATALMINRVLSVGALQIEDDRMLLQHRLPAEGIGVIDLRRVIQYIGSQAQHLCVRGAPLQTTALDYYAD